MLYCPRGCCQSLLSVPCRSLVRGDSLPETAVFGTWLTGHVFVRLFTQLLSVQEELLSLYPLMYCNATASVAVVGLRLLKCALWIVIRPCPGGLIVAHARLCHNVLAVAHVLWYNCLCPVDELCCPTICHRVLLSQLKLRHQWLQIHCPRVAWYLPQLICKDPLYLNVFAVFGQAA